VAIQESQHLSLEILSLLAEMKAASLRHQNAVTAKDAAMKEHSERLKSEQSSKSALEESLSASAKGIEQLKQDPCAFKQEMCGTDNGYSEDDRSVSLPSFILVTSMHTICTLS
jgi:hypothetical protein